MLKIRRPLGRLIFNMGIAIPGKTVFLIETAPSSLSHVKDYHYTSRTSTSVWIRNYIHYKVWDEIVCIVTEPAVKFQDNIKVCLNFRILPVASFIDMKNFNPNMDK